MFCANKLPGIDQSAMGHDELMNQIFVLIKPQWYSIWNKMAHGKNTNLMRRSKLPLPMTEWITEEPFLQSKNSIWINDLLDWCLMYASKYNSTIASNLIENSQCEFIYLWSQRIAMGENRKRMWCFYSFETSTRVPMLFTWQIKIFHTHTNISASFIFLLKEEKLHNFFAI